VIVVEKQGAVVVAYNPLHRPSKKPKTAPRGTVTEFSRKSRRRMLLLLNRCDYNCRVTFLTLTFHSSPTVSQSNEAFKCFVKILRRRNPDVSAIWRREVQPLRGAIHFHLLLFRLAYWPQAEIQALWTRCTGEDRSIVDVRLVHSRKHALRYVSKYIAKPSEPEPLTSLELSPYQAAEEKPSIGRCWGYINLDGLPLAETTVIILDDKPLEDEIWLTAALLTGGRCGNDANMLILLTDKAGEFMRGITSRGRKTRMASPEAAKVCLPTHQRPNPAVFEALWHAA
jgi:hypothetical protein